MQLSPTTSLWTSPKTLGFTRIDHARKGCGRVGLVEVMLKAGPTLRACRSVHCRIGYHEMLCKCMARKAAARRMHSFWRGADAIAYTHSS